MSPPKKASQKKVAPVQTGTENNIKQASALSTQVSPPAKTNNVANNGVVRITDTPIPRKRPQLPDFCQQSWNKKLRYEELHKFTVQVPKLREDKIFIVTIERTSDGKPFFSKPIKELYNKEPNQVLQRFHTVSFEAIRDPKVDLSLNKGVYQGSGKNFLVEALICYRLEGESREDFAKFFCKVMTDFANEVDSGYYGNDNVFKYKPDDNEVDEKPINAILRDQPTARCCKKLYCMPEMSKQQMMEENPDILVKFWGSPELGKAMLDKYDEDQWQRLA